MEKSTKTPFLLTVSPRARGRRSTASTAVDISDGQPAHARTPDIERGYIQNEAGAPALAPDRARNHPQPKLAAEEPYPFAAFDPL